MPWFQTVYFEGNVGGTDDAARNVDQGLSRTEELAPMWALVRIPPAPLPSVDFDEDCLQAAMELCVYALEELHGMDA